MVRERKLIPLMGLGFLTVLLNLCCLATGIYAQAEGPAAGPENARRYRTYVNGNEERRAPNRRELASNDGNELGDELKGTDQSSPLILNVRDFGARGDGTSDDSKAFEKAWRAACSHGPSTILVPQNKNFLLKPITFSGPCTSSSITMKIDGIIVAPRDRSAWWGLNQRHWIVFHSVDNLSLEGGGIIDGNGEIWWENSCKKVETNPCVSAPTAITFYACNNLRMRGLRIKDSQQMHVSFEKCNMVEVDQLMVTAPEESPNTDGIHITATKNIHIKRSTIKTGDDCISIVSGSQNVVATDINCGPGHGISIGSLGGGRSEAHVSKVTVDRANLFGTTNGLRIKTWQGGTGHAYDFLFQNVMMHNVSNPIIIDQNYCDSRVPCHEQGSAVAIQNVVYKNVKGTSATKVAVKFDCSRSSPCSGITLQNVHLANVDWSAAATCSCENVRGHAVGKVIPAPCF